jgi:hypothetical protein
MTGHPPCSDQHASWRTVEHNEPRLETALEATIATRVASNTAPTQKSSGIKLG